MKIKLPVHKTWRKKLPENESFAFLVCFIALYSFLKSLFKFLLLNFTEIASDGGWTPIGWHNGGAVFSWPKVISDLNPLVTIKVFS